MASGAIAKLAEKVVPDARSLIGKMLISGEGALSQQGPSTQLFWRTLKSGLEEADRRAAPHLDDWIQVSAKVPTGQVARELRSGNVTSPAALTAKLKMSDIFNEFVQRGLVGASRFQQNYWPKMYDPKLFEGKNLNDALSHLVRTGQARNAVEAEGLLRFITSGGRSFANVEKRRLANLPGEREDNAVVSDYIHRGYKRLAEVDTFGKNDEILTDMLTKVRSEEGTTSYNYVKWLAEHRLGRRIGIQGPMPSEMESWERSATGVEALTKLSLAVLSQASQFVNIPIVVRGIAPMIRGFARTAANYGDARRYAMESGAIYHQAYRQARVSALEEFDLGAQVLKYTGFTQADKFLRIVASEAGRDAAVGSFVKLSKNSTNTEARGLLQLLGVDAEAALKRGSLSPDDLLSASRRASDISQFQTTVESVPPLWRTSAPGRAVSLYKTYAFQQGKLIKDHVIKPALEGDLKPLVFMSILFPTVGEVVQDLREYARKGHLEDRPDWDSYPADRILDSMANVGVFGIMFDAARSMSYNDRSAFWRFLGGPILSDVVDLAGMLGSFDPLSSHPLDRMSEQAKRKLTRSVPVFGPRLYEEYFRRGEARTRSGFEKGVVTKTFQQLTSNNEPFE